MPDPVPTRPSLAPLRNLSKSFSDLRGLAARVPLPADGPSPETPAQPGGDEYFQLPRSKTPQSPARPSTPRTPWASFKAGPSNPSTPTQAPTGEPGAKRSPPLLGLRPRSKSNASDGARLLRSSKGKQPPLPSRTGALISPPVPTVLRASHWPRAGMVPKLGGHGDAVFVLPPGAWPPGSVPSFFDESHKEALHVLVHSQCEPATLRAYARRSRQHAAALNGTARYLALHCLEKRAMLRSQHAAIERTTHAMVELREALLSRMQKLVDAGCNLSGALREAEHKTLIYFACKWADEDGLSVLLQQNPHAFDFTPFHQKESSVERFCNSLRSNLYMILPELDALARHAASIDELGVSRCYKRIVQVFVGEFSPASNASSQSDLLLFRGLYFFCFFAIRSSSSPMLETVLTVAKEMGLHGQISTVGLHLSLKEGLFSGAHVCLRPEFQSQAFARVASTPGAPKLDYGLPVDLTPLHLLAQQRYKKGRLSEVDACGLARVLCAQGADPRALALVTINTKTAQFERDTLVSASTLALLHKNLELAKCFNQLARLRDQEDKRSAQGPRDGVHEAFVWRATLLSEVRDRLLSVQQLLGQFRLSMPGSPSDSSASLERSDRLLVQWFEHLHVTLRHVFSCNYERGFGLHDTGEVRFLREISRLRLALTAVQKLNSEHAESGIKERKRAFESVVYSVGQSSSALDCIDVHRSDMDRDSPTPPSHREWQRELFEDGASNLHVLREDDRFGSLRPFPLMATASLPGQELYDAFVEVERYRPTFDTVAAFTLSLAGQLDEGRTAQTRAIPHVARQMLEGFVAGSKDVDIVLTGFFLTALRHGHVQAVRGIAASAQRLGGMHRLPLDEIEVVPALVMAAPSAILSDVLKADRHQRWLTKWCLQFNVAGETLLHLAARQDDDHVKILAQASRDSMRRLASTKDASGRTPIVTALECGNVGAAYALWELFPELGATLRPTTPLLNAFLSRHCRCLRGLAALPVGDQFRRVIAPALLAAAIWRDDEKQLSALLQHVTWNECNSFPNKETMLHAIARANSLQCLALLLNEPDIAGAPSKRYLSFLASQQNAMGRLPEQLCLTESMTRLLRERTKQASPFSQTLSSHASSSSKRRLKAFFAKPVELKETFALIEPMVLSLRPNGTTSADLQVLKLRQRQAAYHLMQQRNTKARDEVLEHFLLRPQWFEWAELHDSTLNACHRDNVGWELIRALDDMDSHKAFGVRLNAQMPTVSNDMLHQRLSEGASTAGRFTSGDSIALIELRREALRLCAEVTDGVCAMEPSVDVEVVLRHDRLQAVLAQLAFPSKHLVLTQTHSVRFLLRQSSRTHGVQVLDMHPVDESHFESWHYGRVTPSYGPTTA